MRRWHLDVLKALQIAKSENVFLKFENGLTRSPSIELLLSLEEAIYLKSGPSVIDIIEGPNLCPSATAASAEIVIDLSGAGDPDRNLDYNLIVTPLFDGNPQEDALIGALIEGRSPIIEIYSSREKAVIARAAPALDEARSVRERFEVIVKHTQRALLKALSAPRATTRFKSDAAKPPTLSGLGRYASRLIAAAALKRAYQLCLFSPHWRTGWRFVEDGGIWSQHSLAGGPWTSIADPGYRFYADPFPFAAKGKTAILVEDFDHRTGKGVISAIPFDERGQTGPAEAVLSEPWHLSYPYVFEHRGETWMVPESSQARKISLYRSNDFPRRWVHEADLVSDIDGSDASLIQIGGKWWMFVTVRDELGGLMDGLSLFHADELLGPWVPHPSNPVLIDVDGARQAGWFHLREGRLWRPVQGCRAGYGRALGLAEVTTLNEQEFDQVVRTVLRPDEHWPGRRLHTLNRFGKLECIDGSRNSPRFGASWLRERTNEAPTER